MILYWYNRNIIGPYCLIRYLLSLTVASMLSVLVVEEFRVLQLAMSSGIYGSASVGSLTVESTAVARG